MERAKKVLAGVNFFPTLDDKLIMYFLIEIENPSTSAVSEQVPNINILYLYNALFIMVKTGTMLELQVNYLVLSKPLEPLDHSK